MSESGPPDFEKYLTDENLAKVIKKFGQLNIPTHTKGVEKTAAVLVPLCHVNNHLCLLYTLRTTHLKRNSGQISFPGGMTDNNETAEETAVRETEEEIGIPAKNVRVIGRGVSLVRFDLLITPVVAYIGHIVPSELNINKHEVEVAFAVPLIELCDTSKWKTEPHQGIPLPVVTFEGYRIWGLTALITHLFLKCLLHDIYRYKL